jgi:hypothetical protein
MTPESRRAFERNMHQLNEMFEQDTIQISRSNVRSIRGLQNTRRAPNHRADLNSIDEFSRLMANQVTAMAEHRSELDNNG